MSHDKIFMNVTRNIDNGKITFESAIKNIDTDLEVYNKKVEVFKTYIDECNELKKRLIEKYN